MIILDTNVISELARPTPSNDVIGWVDIQDDLALTAITAAELFYGVARLPEGARKLALTAAIRDLIDERLAGNVLSFDRAAASRYAEIVVSRDRAGRPLSVADGQIAAICRTRNATLATRNVRDFDGVGIVVVNPWTAGSGSDA